MASLTLLGHGPVSERFPGSTTGASSYVLDQVPLTGEHHESLYMIAEQMVEESTEPDYRPTYAHVVKYALHTAAARRQRKR